MIYSRKEKNTSQKSTWESFHNKMGSLFAWQGRTNSLSVAGPRPAIFVAIIDGHANILSKRAILKAK